MITLSPQFHKLPNFLKMVQTFLYYRLSIITQYIDKKNIKAYGNNNDLQNLQWISQKKWKTLRNCISLLKSIWGIYKNITMFEFQDNGKSKTWQEKKN
jgi:hypothetical protein